MFVPNHQMIAAVFLKGSGLHTAAHEALLKAPVWIAPPNAAGQKMPNQC